MFLCHVIMSFPPWIEEHLAVAVESQVHLDAGLAGEDEVPDGRGLRLREGVGSSVGLW